jgi:hypothetical protein
VKWPSFLLGFFTAVPGDEGSFRGITIYSWELIEREAEVAAAQVERQNFSSKHNLKGM